MTKLTLSQEIIKRAKLLKKLQKGVAKLSNEGCRLENDKYREIASICILKYETIYKKIVLDNRVIYSIKTDLFLMRTFNKSNLKMILEFINNDIEHLKNMFVTLSKIINESRNKVYKYSYRNKGFSVGCQPNDFINVEKTDLFEIISYKRELTNKEISDYELIQII